MLRVKEKERKGKGRLDNCVVLFCRRYAGGAPTCVWTSLYFAVREGGHETRLALKATSMRMCSVCLQCCLPQLLSPPPEW